MSQVQDSPPAARTEPLRTERIPADLVENETGWQIHLALAGVAEEDIEVQVESGTLAVRATRRARPTEGVRVLQRGPGEARLEREFVLPDGVGPDAVEAELDAGILRVSFARPLPERTAIPIRRA